jgi:hypothetical protein
MSPRHKRTGIRSAWGSGHPVCSCAPGSQSVLGPFGSHSTLRLDVVGASSALGGAGRHGERQGELHRPFCRPSGCFLLNRRCPQASAGPSHPRSAISTAPHAITFRATIRQLPRHEPPCYGRTVTAGPAREGMRVMPRKGKAKAPDIDVLARQSRPDRPDSRSSAD